MEQSGEIVAVAVYLAILAFAVAWFLLPRWLKRRRANQREEARRPSGSPAGSPPVPGPDLR